MKELGKYAAIGFSALSIYELCVLLLDQLGNYAVHLIQRHIESQLQKTYELLGSLGKYVVEEES